MQGKPLFSLVHSMNQLDQPCQNGEIGILLSLEYFEGVFARDPLAVDRLRAQGIMSITLVDNSSDRLITSSSSDAQLTELGRQVVARMNDVGVLVDISHLSEVEVEAKDKTEPSPSVVRCNLP
ncbi:MAG: membrane dipeptidase [Thermoanaerobaculia bacterium]